MTKRIITVAREYGSGGRIIAKKLAESLGVPFYDRELIQLAARRSGLAEDFIQETEERKVQSFFGGMGFGVQGLPMADQVFLAESEVIKQVAGEGPCVIVGRCADYVLRRDFDCLKVFIHAPLEYRVRRVQEEYHVQAKNIQDFVLKQDKNRATYYDYFTTGHWGRCQSYDLSVSSALGVDTVVDLIRTLAEKQ